MKRFFALILLSIHIGMLVLPFFLMIMMCKTSEETQKEVILPYFHSSTQPLVGDSSYLLAILERATSQKSCKDKTIPPINSTDLSPSVYCLPSSLSLNIISTIVENKLYYKVIFIQSVFQDVLTPPPKLA